MTELKTLEDIPCKDFPNASAFIQGKTFYEKHDLRQEVIKWIKDLEQRKTHMQIPCPDRKPGCCVLHYIPSKDTDAQVQADWIKHFFNITETDLMEENNGK